MSSKLDQSLDSIIASSKPVATGRGGGSRSGPSKGPSTNIPNTATRGARGPIGAGVAGAAAGARFHPYNVPTRPINQPWTHDLFAAQAAAAAAAAAAAPAAPQIVSDTILVSNIPKHVTSDDVRDIFAGVGPIASLNLFYDQNGRSAGTAQVVFRTAAHAAQAADDFDQATVDGQKITVKLIGGSVAAKPVVQKAAQQVVHVPVPVPVPQPVYAPSFPPRNPLGGGPGAGPRGVPRGAPGGRFPPRAGGIGGGGDRGARPAQRPRKPLSAADLDADLDAYHSTASKSDNGAAAQSAATDAATAASS